MKVSLLIKLLIPEIKFSTKAILGTALFLIVYQLFFNLFCAYDYMSFLWIQYNQIVFATSTSILAVFWSLFALRRYERIANLGDLITTVYGDLEKFMKVFKQIQKVIEYTDSGPQKDPKEILKEWNNRGSE